MSAARRRATSGSIRAASASSCAARRAWTRASGHCDGWVAKTSETPREARLSSRTREVARRVGYAIVFVSDMRRSIAFYRDVVGLPLRFESPGWTEFATDGATLALHSSNAPADSAPAAERNPAGRCRPGFTVADID